MNRNTELVHQIVYSSLQSLHYISLYEQVCLIEVLKDKLSAEGYRLVQVQEELFHRWVTEMSKKRGLSADEKKSRMLEIFHQSKDFFQLKELEKIAPKEKGITMQSVKEVVQSLVDDHLVDSEKIGTSIYFWSFPSKARTAKKRKLNELQSELDDCTKKLKKTEDAIVSELVGRENNPERIETLAELEKMLKEEEKLKKELQKYRDCDPEYIAQLKTDTENLKGAINRWTENIYILKSYIKNTFQMENDVIDQSFGIPQDLDYIE